VCGDEMLTFAIFCECEHVLAGLAVKDHRFKVLIVYLRQRRRHLQAADPQLGVAEKPGDWLELLLKQATITAAGLVGDTGKAHRDRRGRNLAMDLPKSSRIGFLRRGQRSGFGSRRRHRGGQRRRRALQLVLPGKPDQSHENRNGARQQNWPRAGDADRADGLLPGEGVSGCWLRLRLQSCTGQHVVVVGLVRQSRPHGVVMPMW